MAGLSISLRHNHHVPQVQDGGNYLKDAHLVNVFHACTLHNVNVLNVKRLANVHSYTANIVRFIAVVLTKHRKSFSCLHQIFSIVHSLDENVLTERGVCKIFCTG